MPSIHSLYPRACDNRLPTNHPVLKKARGPFFRAAGTNFLFLQVLFLGLFCYIFASLYQQTRHTHNLQLAFVDYDGGAIGHAVRNAYASLQGNAFPSLVERSPSDLQTPADIREAVCRTSYWGALYVTKGASDRLEDALAGGDAASAYDSKGVMAYIWNEAVYAPVVDAAVSANLQLLSNAARVAYSSSNGTGNIRSVSGQALSVLAKPWTLQSINIQPTTQGSRAIYNTVVIILILIQEFFYLATINGLYAQFKVYSRVDAYRIIAVRNAISLTYTFIGSLCVIGTIWAFKAGWNINGNQFVLSWAILWLFAHVNFLTLDVFTVWLPQPFVPMALVSWISFNITSILLPFDLSPAFFRIGYIWPAHEVYQILTDIWSRGCNPQLRYALPILFTWEVVALTLSALGVFRRCHFAVLAEEQQEKASMERIDAAVSFELARERERMQKHAESSRPESQGEPEKPPPSDTNTAEDGEEEHVMREELADVIERVTTRQRRELQRTGTTCHFGPSFDLPFNYDNESSDGK